MKIQEKTIEILKEKLPADKLQSLSLLAGFELSEDQVADRLAKLGFTQGETENVLSAMKDTVTIATKDYSHLNSTVQDFYRPPDGWNQASIEDIEIVDNPYKEGTQQYKFTCNFSGNQLYIFTTMIRSGKDSKFNKIMNAFFKRDEKIDFNKVIGQKFRAFCVTTTELDGKTRTKYEKFEKIDE